MNKQKYCSCWRDTDLRWLWTSKALTDKYCKKAIHILCSFITLCKYTVTYNRELVCDGVQGNMKTQRTGREVAVILWRMVCRGGKERKFRESRMQQKIWQKKHWFIVLHNTIIKQLSTPVAVQSSRNNKQMEQCWGGI